MSKEPFIQNRFVKKLEKLLEYFNNYGEVTDGISKLIMEMSEIKTYSSGKFLDSPLDMKPNIYFVLRGAVRGFVRDDLHEITTWIALDGSIVGLTSFEKNHSFNRTQFIQTLEETEVVILPYQLIIALFASQNEMFLIGRNLLWLHYQQLDEFNFLARLPTSEKRFMRLNQIMPGIIQRIKLKYIASLLCMRMETLSRLKSRLTHEKII
ncbi:Crp/Fnr family transcriptional regulator [Pedobacter agri]|uniref:Crp/Fnr family transcriptional regulator n=1 Tax=Pedobacter agri TaxID=454586 RepID=UPI00292D0F35|nr:hypothetical protein [Pedobacter agri]